MNHAYFDPGKDRTLVLIVGLLNGYRYIYLYLELFSRSTLYSDSLHFTILNMTADYVLIGGATQSSVITSTFFEEPFRGL